MQQTTKEYAQEVFRVLKQHYPHAKMVLEWSNNFELLMAVILSAQCTDKKVNEVTSRVFPKYKHTRPEFASQYSNYTRILLPKEQINQEKNPHVANAPQDDKLDRAMIIQLVNFAFVPITEFEQDIKSTGFYHNKAKNVQAAAKVVLEKFQGVLPRSIDELTTIPGVGRKTANVFLGNAYGIYEGIAVDTHVTKQAQLLGLTKNKTPEKIEQDLMKLFPKDQWFPLTYLLIEHGRNMRRSKKERLTCGKSDCFLCSSKTTV